VQVSDTPPVRLQVTEYQMAEVACPACRAVTRAATPAGLAGPCYYGPNVRAATALLACNGHMSIERAADLMGVLLDAPVSTGFTGGLVARVAACLAEFEGTLKQRLRTKHGLPCWPPPNTPRRGPAGLRPTSRLRIHLAQRRCRARPGRRVGRAQCRRPAQGLRQAHRRPRPDSQVPDRGRTTRIRRWIAGIRNP